MALGGIIVYGIPFAFALVIWRGYDSVRELMPWFVVVVFIAAMGGALIATQRFLNARLFDRILMAVGACAFGILAATLVALWAALGGLPYYAEVFVTLFWLLLIYSPLSFGLAISVAFVIGRRRRAGGHGPKHDNL